MLTRTLRAGCRTRTSSPLVDTGTDREPVAWPEPPKALVIASPQYLPGRGPRVRFVCSPS